LHEYQLLYCTVLYFDSNIAFYYVTVATFNRFQDHIDSTAASLEVLDQHSKERDLAWNSIVWSTFDYLVKASGEGIFSIKTLGDPLLLFGEGLFMATVTGNSGYCDVDIEVDFDSSAGRYTFFIENYNTDPTCPNLLNPSNLQKETLFGPPPPDLKFDIDMYAYTMAVAINLGILDFENLVQMSDSSVAEGSDDDFSDDDYYYYGDDATDDSDDATDDDTTDDDATDDDATESTTVGSVSFTIFGNSDDIPTDAPSTTERKLTTGSHRAHSSRKSLNTRLLEQAASEVGLKSKSASSKPKGRLLQDDNGQYNVDFGPIYDFKRVVQRLNRKTKPLNPPVKEVKSSHHEADLVTNTYKKVDFDFIRAFNQHHREHQHENMRKLEEKENNLGINTTAGDILFAYYSPQYVGMDPVYW